jgi:hypothetical protein
MLANPQPPRLHLPKSWQDCVKLAVLHAIALAHYAIVYARAWAADSISTGATGRVRTGARHLDRWPNVHAARIGICAWHLPARARVTQGDCADLEDFRPCSVRVLDTPDYALCGRSNKRVLLSAGAPLKDFGAHTSFEP